jgi:hypothetical protein
MSNINISNERFPSEDALMLLEGDGSISAGLVKASRYGGNAIPLSDKSIRRTMSGVRAGLDIMLRELLNSQNEPSEIEITLGLKASNEPGVLLVTKGIADANYTVTLKWQSKRAGE